MALPNDDKNTLAQATWNCKHHVMFVLNPRRKVFFGGKRTEIREKLRLLSLWREASISEEGVYPEYLYLPVNSPPDKCNQLHGISEREKQPEDISAIRKHGVCILKRQF